MISETIQRNRPSSSLSPGRRRGLCITLLVAAAVSNTSHAFMTPTPTAPSTQLQMIGNIFGGGNDSKVDPQLPKDVKDAVSKCRGAVQKGLEDRISRMDIEMPVGANFGVEKQDSKKKRGNLSSMTGDEQEDGLTIEKLETSNRELARLFVEMFQPLGGEHIAAVFNDASLAELARQRWSNDISTECNILAIDRKGKRGLLNKAGMKMGTKGKKKKAKGFAAKMADEMEEDNSASGPFNLPKDTEVALFVSPGPKELIAIERICNEGGMGTCVILLNARLSQIEKYASAEAEKLFTEDFEPVFSLSAAPQFESPGCLMHRAYPGQWVLARKPRVGPPKTIALQKGKFSGDDCKEAYSQIEVSELERGTEKLAENVAGWFN